MEHGQAILSRCPEKFLSAMELAAGVSGDRCARPGPGVVARHERQCCRWRPPARFPSSRWLTPVCRYATRRRMTSGERFALATLAVGCSVLGLKSVAWWLTGSAALYSDALESIVNVAASVVAWAALRLAARPADTNHLYGHDKAEFFSAVIEGALIVVAAALIFEAAWTSWWHP